MGTAARGDKTVGLSLVAAVLMREAQSDRKTAPSGAVFFWTEVTGVLK